MTNNEKKRTFITELTDDEFAKFSKKRRDECYRTQGNKIKDLILDYIKE